MLCRLVTHLLCDLCLIAAGQGTRDMAGPDGLTTEAFIDKVPHSTPLLPWEALVVICDSNDSPHRWLGDWADTRPY